MRDIKSAAMFFYPYYLLLCRLANRYLLRMIWRYSLSCLICGKQSSIVDMVILLV